jgi:hypothetical protein
MMEQAVNGFDLARIYLYIIVDNGLRLDEIIKLQKKIGFPAPFVSPTN